MTDATELKIEGLADAAVAKLQIRLQRYMRDRRSLKFAFAGVVAGSRRRSPEYRMLARGDRYWMETGFFRWLDSLPPDKSEIIRIIICKKGNFCKSKKGYTTISQAICGLYDYFVDENSGAFIHVAAAISFDFLEEFCDCPKNSKIEL